MLVLSAVVWLVFLSVQTVRAWRFSAKNILFSAALISLFYAALHLICLVFVKLMSSRDDRLAMRVMTSLAEEHKMGIRAMLSGATYEMYDRDIGWVLRPGYSGDGVTISQQGLRSHREYAIPPLDPERRFLCLGDSFTFGNGVSDTETYPACAEQLRPGTEWVNLGISGSCLTQCLLHYRKNGRKFGGRHVVIGFMTDDGKRTVNSFRAFLTPYNPFTKPFAKYSNGKFSIEPNPYQDISDYQKLLANEGPEIERLVKIDYLTWSNQAASRNPVLRTAGYVVEAMHVERNIDVLLHRPAKKVPVKATKTTTRVDPYSRLTWDESEKHWSFNAGGVDPYGQAIWNPDSPGFVALTRVFDLLYNEIITDGRVPLIVLIPGPFDVENYRRQYPRVYGSLVDHLKAKGYHCLDFLDPLVALHKDDLSMKTIFVARHFRPSINKELAARIIKELQVP
ncbi:hypothetical protein AYO49_00480 [Verrucomicrobiaceae bacterium SCGC AG-212-N21]|nr:hypothetical protein AYO49_00480 [Verrucomicrobiaceae bacterium SCGC AG-212-N21]